MDMLTWEKASIGSFTAHWNPSQAVNLQCEEDKSLLRSEKELFLFSGVQSEYQVARSCSINGRTR